MYQLNLKIKTLKNNLKDINTHLASYARNLQQNRQKLEVTKDILATNPLNQQLIEEEQVLLQGLHKWSIVEEQALSQNLRATWIACGDSNSKYFHAQCKIRASRNAITFVYNDQGVKLYDPDLVEHEFVKFFSNLLSSTVDGVPCPNSEVIRRGPFLSI